MMIEGHHPQAQHWIHVALIRLQKSVLDRLYTALNESICLWEVRRTCHMCELLVVDAIVVWSVVVHDLL